MARTARGFRSDRLRGPRRLTGWEEGPGGSTVTVFTDSLAAALGSVLTVLQDGLTIVRLRGSLQAFLTVGGDPGGFHCALGACIVSNDAAAVGITAIPDPIADMDWDGWFYHRFFDVHSPGVFDGADQSNSIQFEVDSKAMRKVGVNDTVVVTLEAVETGAASMSVFFDSRILLKLP